MTPDPTTYAASMEKFLAAITNEAEKAAVLARRAHVALISFASLSNAHKKTPFGMCIMKDVRAGSKISREKTKEGPPYSTVMAIYDQVTKQEGGRTDTQYVMGLLSSYTPNASTILRLPVKNMGPVDTLWWTTLPNWAEVSKKISDLDGQLASEFDELERDGDAQDVTMDQPGAETEQRKPEPAEDPEVNRKRGLSESSTRAMQPSQAKKVRTGRGDTGMQGPSSSDSDHSMDAEPSRFEDSSRSRKPSPKSSAASNPAKQAADTALSNEISSLVKAESSVMKSELRKTIKAQLERQRQNVDVELQKLRSEFLESHTRVENEYIKKLNDIQEDLRRSHASTENYCKTLETQLAAMVAISQKAVEKRNAEDAEFTDLFRDLISVGASNAVEPTPAPRPQVDSDKGKQSARESISRDIDELLTSDDDMAADKKRAAPRSQRGRGRGGSSAARGGSSRARKSAKGKGSEE